MRIVSGSSAEKIYFVAFSTADHLTRVSDHTTAGFTVRYIKDGSTVTANSAFSNPDGSSSPGVYALHLIDSTLTALGAGIDSRELCITISGSMDTVTRTVELYRRTVTTGLTLTVNSSGEGATSLGAMLSSVNAKVSSIDTDIDTALTRLTSINAETTALVVLATSINTRVNAIQAQTTQFAFTQTGKVDANIHYVNNVQVTGTGSTADTWRPV